MQIDPVSAKARRMPKEKLPDVMTVRFQANAFARIDAIAGEHKRAKFIRDAVESELQRREKKPRKE